MNNFSLPQDGFLIEENIPDEILHKYEKIHTKIFDLPQTASLDIAQTIIDAVNACKERNFKLGLSTGSSPVFLYKALAESYKKGEVSFKNVEIFSIDEYYPLCANKKQSRNYLLRTELLDKVDIAKNNIHIPAPDKEKLSKEEISSHCAGFDAIAQNLDLLVMGVGFQGQVAFNEIGSSEKSKTGTVLLPYKTRKKQKEIFDNSIEKTPSSAITMGISTMLSAKKIILMAWGEDKADAVKAIAEGEQTSYCPASFLQSHGDIILYVDENSSLKLSRVVAPWLVGPCHWTAKFVRKAVVWLCQTVGKSILKLTQQDYLENSLGELLELYGPYDKINIDVFNDLQHTITGWPGGKPNSLETTRPVSSSPYPKTVLIFSPHPDDDVISMGGTFIRLVHQGHDVHVAYQTSGNVAVHDDVVLQHVDAAYQLGYGDKIEQVKGLIAAKKPGEPEPKELLAMKAAIRRSEARGAVRSFGLDDERNVHFLNLPFYESGGIEKLPRTQKDVDIIKELIVKIKPNQIYMAGDLADPHGTHRVCTEAALEALEQLKAEGCTWLDSTNVWLYRGAWMEWELDRVDMAVPLSPDELVEKRHSIFRHLSQKDIVPFPGDDPREFWQRAEERTQTTAKLYNDLGMAEYQAIEVFLKLY